MDPTKSHLFIQKGFINGEWVDATHGERFSVQDPATNKILGSCPEFVRDDVDRAIIAASGAFQTFRNTTPRERARMLRRWHDLVQEHKGELASLITLENGKALQDSVAEVAYAASFLEWFSEEAPRTYGDVIPASVKGRQIITIKEPVGVCALITPWNFPAAMITRKAGAALAAGCTVVIKSPDETPFTVNALVELAKKAGIPKGVINVVAASKNTIEVVHALTSSRLVNKISFTGSTAVGKILMKQCAETTLKKITLELGGNAPFIVFDDADIAAAVEGIVASKFRGSGQTCVSANRIYVQENVYEDLANRLAERVNDFVVGNSLSNSKVTHGPLINQRAVQKSEEHVRDGVSKGARIAVGGSRMPELGPNYFQPTVLTNMKAEMQLVSDETFGPVAGLFSFKTEQDVIKLANDTEMGLAAYVYTKDSNRIARVTKGLEVGMIGVNTGIISDAAAPFGGVKSSGFGREGSRYGIDEYVTIKSLTLDGAELCPQSRL